MSFCAKCGRRRDGDARYCGGCGAEYEEPAGEPAAVPDGVTGADLTAGLADGATRTDLAAAAPRTEEPDARPDPFASWYQPQAPVMPPGGLREGAGEQWQPTETVQASPAGSRSGYQPAPAAPVPPPAPPFAPFPPGRPAGPPEPASRRGLFTVVAVAVVLAAGGGAYALASSLGKHSTAQPPAQSSVSAPASTGSPASTPATSPGTGGTPTPSPALSLVAIAPGVSAGAAGSQVETLLSHYFDGINNHDYQEYASTLNAAQRATQSQSTFSSGYATTTDSNMTLTSLATASQGLTATVTFISRQAAAQSVDHSGCNNWTLNLYLVPQGNGYLIGPAPAGYKPSYADC